MRSALIALLAAGLVVSAGCQQLKDVAAVYGALDEHFHRQMNVTINNNSHLVITVVNAPEHELDDAGREAYARDIAVYAKSRWPHPDALEDITVAYSTVNKTGPITFTNNDRSYRWSASKLSVVGEEPTLVRVPAAQARD